MGKSTRGNYVHGTVAQRFWPKVVRDPETECWEWIANRLPKGYGLLGSGPAGGPTLYAHRVAYELVIGPIPEGFQVDHLCRNTGCVNPAHLEPVTPRENLLRGDGPSAKNARKTHCIHGHPFDEANTYRYSQGRVCRACHAEIERRRRARRKEAGI